MKEPVSKNLSRMMYIEKDMDIIKQGNLRIIATSNNGSCFVEFTVVDADGNRVFHFIIEYEPLRLALVLAAFEAVKGDLTFILSRAEKTLETMMKIMMENRKVK